MQEQIVSCLKGSDSGGSVRNPSHNCGIVGLKPTSGRFPLHGQALDGGLPGVPGVLNSGGFMVRNVPDLCKIHQIILNHLDHRDAMVILRKDPRFVPIPWKVIEPKRNLVFGW